MRTIMSTSQADSSPRVLIAVSGRGTLPLRSSETFRTSLNPSSAGPSGIVSLVKEIFQEVINIEMVKIKDKKTNFIHHRIDINADHTSDESKTS